MNSLRATVLLGVLLGLAHVPVAADVRLPGVLASDMVVQRDQPIVLWGWADAQETVAATLGNEKATTRAGPDGRWRLTLPAQPAGGPVEITITGNNTITLRNVLIGDVWLCSGQSNMEWTVEKSLNAEQEIAGADHPQIRLFSFPRTKAVDPQDACPGTWAVCSPKSAGSFSAAAYFFGRELQPAIGVPLGLVHSSYGGTPAEAWMCAETLDRVAEMKPLLDQMRAEAEAWTSGATMAAYREKLDRWKSVNVAPGDAPRRKESFIAADEVNSVAFAQVAWATTDAGMVGSGAKNILSTTLALGAGDFDIRALVSLDRVAESSAHFILGNSHFGFSDMTWGRMFTRGPIFGESTALVGKTDEFLRDNMPFHLELARRGATLTITIDGKKALAVDCGSGPIGTLGFCPGRGTITVKELSVDGVLTPPSTATIAFAKPVEPTDPRLRHFHPSTLFNGMIAPLLPVRLRGVIWYQGESNHERAVQYRTLFPALVQSWRTEWQQPNLPFLFVQLANYGKTEPEPSESDWAELREAQAMTLSVPHTAMAVAIDVGEGPDIHPRNKQAVGARLALAARAQVYGENIVHSGPLYRAMSIEGDKIRLSFDHLGGGLVIRGERLQQFAVAGADRRFHWAEARIDGGTILVSSPEVPEPVAVRYAWASNPQGCNLYNAAGLPASPCRTDSWPVLSTDRRTR